MLSFTTKGIPKKEQFEYWGALFNQRGIRLALDTQQPRGFYGELKSAVQDDVVLSHIICSENKVIRNKSHIAMDDNLFFLLYIPLNDQVLLKSGDNLLKLSPGEVGLLNTEYQMETYLGSRNILSVRIPQTRLPHIDRSQAVLVNPCRDLASQLLFKRLFALFDQVLSSPSEVFKLKFDQVLTDMVTALFCSTTGKSSRGKAFILAQTQMLIEQHAQEALTVKLICEKLRISEVYLYKCLAYFNTSYRSLVSIHRTRQAARLMVNSSAQTKLQEIAIEVGFSNQSHFSTAFSAQFSLSPKRFRQRFSASIP
ncbi:AraC family transcriptional regulator [Bowmanella pacifica]|uniref:Transcriptional regulator FeaR n=1 Tax=Bowmanella pacifica TaxID=502051 RepID=A0A917YXN4_9ALTE|nr:AraC family transcriptional regulator [Bowmanella pacifica]GGO68341.1 transcriptional regulator FeaR [Bowmanella pacifica]